MRDPARKSEETRIQNGRPQLNAGPAHTLALVLAVGYGLTLLLQPPPLASMVAGDLLDTPRRHGLLLAVLIWTLVSLLGLVVLWLAAARRRPWADRRDTLALLTATLWPLTLLPLAAYAFNRQVWTVAPVLLYGAALAVCSYSAYRTNLPPLVFRIRRLDVQPWLPAVLLAVMITAYICWVSLHTIRHHYGLGTSAYDLGIHENFLWNTIHGDWFYSSIEGGSHLGVHTSFAMLMIAPLYAAFPATETLLFIQTMLLGLAAWPLFGAARSVTGSGWTALVVASLWLAHPGVAGANFYDFHAVVFAPFFFFFAAWMWRTGRWRWFWVWVFLLLTVKEDMGFLVVALGLVLLIDGDRRRGAIAVAAGAVSYLVLQHGVIPFFSPGGHSYVWYFPQVIPEGEGPAGALVTAFLNPVFTIRFALTPTKVLYVMQLLAPLALLPLRTVRGVLLVGYGLSSALLATRPPMFELGFQYALVILAPAFVGLLIAVGDRSPSWRSRALAVAVMLSIITTFHYGMIWPGADFAGGFRKIEFSLDGSEREDYAEVASCAERIPAEATVLASEVLVPHVARRHTVMTTRDIAGNPRYPFDAIFLLKDDNSRLLGFLVAAAQRRGLVVVHDGEHCLLLLRSHEEGAGSSIPRNS